MMSYQRAKLAPWEDLTDGQWHPVREGPVDEDRVTSLRAYDNYSRSARDWATRNGYRVNVSRTECGRLIRVRFTPAGSHDGLVAFRDATRNEIGASLMTALNLLERVMQLRIVGELDGTWAHFDRECEAYLRQIRDRAERVEREAAGS